MYKICQTEKSIARQRELENGFLDYLESVPFLEIDIAGLCRYLEIPRKTFYRYFGTKEDALHALIDHRLQDLDQLFCRAEQRDLHAFRQDALAFFTFWKEQKRFLDILNERNLTSAIFSRINAPYIISIRKHFYILHSVYSENPYLYTFLISSAMAVVIRWHAGGYQESIHQMAELMESMIASPLMNQLQYTIGPDISKFTKNS